MTKYLFIHQNFPGQFLHVARELANDPLNLVVGIGDASNIARRPPIHPRIKTLGYSTHGKGGKATHHYLREHEGHIRRGQSLARFLIKLRDQKGFYPDVVVCHPAWGEGLFLKDVFPKAKNIQYFEFYYQSAGADMDFDPEFPAVLDDVLRLRIKNNTQLQSLASCDYGVSPTSWQRSRYPADFQPKIEVMHEGIDTLRVVPDRSSSIEFDGQLFRAGELIVTYVARNLEPYRGFHVFLRSLPRLQELCPGVRVIIVGGDDVSYGRRPPTGVTYRDMYTQELGSQVDWKKVFFVGKLPYPSYLKVLQVSAAHVYLTYPFVLSWSMLEAMAAGCLVVGSDTRPVREVIQDGYNGLLVDFFATDLLAERISDALINASRYEAVRLQARQTILDRFDLNGVCLPKLINLFRQRG